MTLIPSCAHTQIRYRLTRLSRLIAIVTRRCRLLMSRLIRTRSRLLMSLTHPHLLPETTSLRCPHRLMTRRLRSTLTRLMTSSRLLQPRYALSLQHPSIRRRLRYAHRRLLTPYRLTPTLCLLLQTLSCESLLLVAIQWRLPMMIQSRP